MRKLYIILLAGIVSLSAVSCTKWLSIEPADQVTGEELFKVGTGYRNALNGVYKQLSSSSLYGRNLTYGSAEFLARNYYGPRISYSAEGELFNYSYTTTQAKGQIASIWETAYTAVANCNSIIGKIASEPDSKFKGGKLERELILGETLALRGFLHFIALTYFAPAPITENTKIWIPYYDKFPSTVADYLTVDQTIERITADLKAGYELVEPWDNHAVDDTNFNRRLLQQLNRFKTDGRVSDFFYAFRGYRMNVTAISALLARVYSYAGEHELAVDQARKVIDFDAGYDENSPAPAFSFTPTENITGNYKMSHDLIFALSDPNLVQNYTEFINTESIRNLQMSYNIYPDIFDSASDYRLTALMDSDGWDAYPKRFKVPVKGSSTHLLDILPVIRLSEMYYILAEAYAADEDYTNATAMLETVRKGRDCGPNGLEDMIYDQDSFNEELLNEVRREFAEEGLTFYYFKKRNVKITRVMKDESFYFPLPDTETIH